MTKRAEARRGDEAERSWTAHGVICKAAGTTCEGRCNRGVIARNSIGLDRVTWRALGARSRPFATAKMAPSPSPHESALAPAALIATEARFDVESHQQRLGGSKVRSPSFAKLSPSCQQGSRPAARSQDRHASARPRSLDRSDASGSPAASVLPRSAVRGNRDRSCITRVAADVTAVVSTFLALAARSHPRSSLSQSSQTLTQRAARSRDAPRADR